MTDHIVLHRASIQTILRQLTKSTPSALDGFDTNSVFALAPATLLAAQLPAAYSLLGSADFDEVADGEKFQVLTRTYRIQVPVLPIGLATAELRESSCQPLLEKVNKKLGGYPTLNNTAFVRRARVQSDSGIVILPEFGMQYVGFEVRLRVTYVDKREFGPGE